MHDAPSSTIVETLSLTVLDRNVQILCQDAEAQAVLLTNFGHHLQGNLESINLTYVVGKQQDGLFFIKRDGQGPLFATDTGEFLFLFEQDMTVELQRLRADLYFVHSAVLEFAGRACMLVAVSRSGKSTTSWALSHHGFRYLSDELGPVDPKTLEVYPYSHALCLKNEPPARYPLPRKTLTTSRSRLVPVEALPGGNYNGPIALGAIFFVGYRPDTNGASVWPISSAEGAARLFANALNPLAHPRAGLDVAIEIAKNSACFELSISNLPAACALVKTALEKLFPGEGRENSPSERES